MSKKQKKNDVIEMSAFPPEFKIRAAVTEAMEKIRAAIFEEGALADYHTNVQDARALLIQAAQDLGYIERDTSQYSKAIAQKILANSGLK